MNNNNSPIKHDNHHDFWEAKIQDCQARLHSAKRRVNKFQEELAELRKQMSLRNIRETIKEMFIRS